MLGSQTKMKRQKPKQGEHHESEIEGNDNG
jgi:hypothetical protein